MAARMGLVAAALALWALGAAAGGVERFHSTASDDLQTEGLVQWTRHLLGPEEDKKLWNSAAKGWLKPAETALENGANIDVQLFKFQRTPILAAILGNHSEVVTLLINAGADLEIADKDGETPLLAAIFENDLGLVKQLLAAGASPNGDPSLDKPRKAAAAAAANEAAVEAPTSGRRHKKKSDAAAKGAETSLNAEAPTAGAEDEEAEAKGAEEPKKHKKKARGLLQAGDDPDAFSIGADPAAAAAPVDPVDSTVDPFAPAVDPASAADASNGTAASDANIVEPTTKHNHKGRVARHKDDQGVRLTPLILASAGGNAEIVQVLLEYGAIPDLGDDLGDTALHKASLMLGKGSEEIAKMLLAAGVDVDVRGFRGRTPLFSASEFGNLDVVKILLGANANPEITDLDGQTAVDVVCDCASLEMFNLCPDGRCEKKWLRRAIARFLNNPRAPKVEEKEAPKKGAPKKRTGRGKKGGDAAADAAGAANAPEGTQ